MSIITFISTDAIFACADLGHCQEFVVDLDHTERNAVDKSKEIHPK